MDDQALIDRLRSDLRAERAATVAPDGLHVSGHRRWQRRRARRAWAGAVAAVALVLGGAAVAAAQVDEGASVGTRRLSPPDGTATTAPEGPSQTPEDAARDGVDPDVAALPMSVRRGVVAGQDGPPEGRYVINRPPGPAVAEVLLLDGEDRIVRAFPMGGLEPTWLDVTAFEVFGGLYHEAGFGGRRPAVTVFRIDRRTLELTGMVFPNHGMPVTPGRDGYVETTADRWRPAPDGVLVDDLVGVDQRPGWEPAISTDDPVWVDRAALGELFGQPPR
jgi:hypothetical protein